MRIAVIAPGSMGAAVARRLRARGATVAMTLEGRGPARAARAVGVTLLDSEAALAGWADVVLSIVPPGEALALAVRLASVLVGRSGVIYADCNAVSPDTVRAVAGALPGIGFVDIGIIGGPPRGEDAGPRLYASGDAAVGLRPLADRGIDLRVIEGGIGAASALKMSYAGITKGLTALGSAMALAATSFGAAKVLHDELSASQPELLEFLERGVPGMFDKAYRWVAEMEEVAAFVGDGPGGAIYTGVARLYETIAADRADPDPAGPVAALHAFFREPGAR
jgi:3-hydroxyisobutyrate dehydrogenase-like beta-hydroxyacid dehydrogenase